MDIGHASKKSHMLHDLARAGAGAGATELLVHDAAWLWKAASAKKYSPHVQEKSRLSKRGRTGTGAFAKWGGGRSCGSACGRT